MELFNSLLYQNIVKITKLSEELAKICNFQEKDFLSFKLYFFLCCCNFAKFSDSFCSVVCQGVVLEMWKQSFTDALQNKCSSKFRKFHMKAPVMESFFNKVTGACNFIKKRLQHGCLPTRLKTRKLRKPWKSRKRAVKQSDCVVYH